MNLRDEKLNRPNILYILSIVFLAFGLLLAINPQKNGSNTIDGITYYGNYMFITIGLYALIALLCYILGLIKIKKHSNKIEDYKYKINHFYGFFNLMIILPLNFGLLFMMITNDIVKYSSLIEVIGYLIITIFFIISFILRKTLFKEEASIGLLAFDESSIVYFGYAFIMVLLNYLGIRIVNSVFFIIFGLNIIIVHITAYYPAKAMVYALFHEEYNPIKTIYLFVRKLVDTKIFFYIGLIFTFGLGIAYYLFSNSSSGPIYILQFISMFYIGEAVVKFFSYMWNQKIMKSNASSEEKTHSLYKIMVFNSITSFILTLLLASLFVFIFTDKLDKEVSIWFILIQGNFVGLRIMISVFDVIRNHKNGNPYFLSQALNGVLYTLVLIYSFLLSVFIFFRLNDSLLILSIILIFINLSTGMSISGYMLVRSILGFKGIIKRKVE